MVTTGAGRGGGGMTMQVSGIRAQKENLVNYVMLFRLEASLYGRMKKKRMHIIAWALAYEKIIPGETGEILSGSDQHRVRLRRRG